MSVHTPTAPPIAPGPLPPPRRSALDNKHGLVGLVLCGAAVLSAPGVEFGIPHSPLAPAAGVVGVVLCIVGCFRRPRRYAVIGLLAAVLSVAFWSVVDMARDGAAARKAAVYGLSASTWEDTSRACFLMACAVEQVRASTGSPPATTNTSRHTDPWGRAYRYVLVPVTAKNPYGYTFTSDGPDGKPGTPDDLDLIVMHASGVMSQLPPPNAAGPAPSTPVSPPASR
ncbi:MAG: hypothetical protein QM783_17960 [Phycisphaerales bacterium]